jgi:cell division protein FtsN
MAQDFARKRKPAAKRKKAAPRKQQPAPQPGNGLRWFLVGLTTGVVGCFLLYLTTLPGNTPAQAPSPRADATATAPAEAQEPPKPRFDFYTMLPEQTLDVEENVPEAARAHSEPQTEYYLLQAGSFKQREDADRRRAELLLLGLDPRIEAAGDSGQWFRVYLGPFESRSAMAKARSLTASQDIDTLLLKRRKQ